MEKKQTLKLRLKKRVRAKTELLSFEQPTHLTDATVVITTTVTAVK